MSLHLTILVHVNGDDPIRMRRGPEPDLLYFLTVGQPGSAEATLTFEDDADLRRLRAVIDAALAEQTGGAS